MQESYFYKTTLRDYVQDCIPIVQSYLWQHLKVITYTCQETIVYNVQAFDDHLEHSAASLVDHTEPNQLP